MKNPGGLASPFAAVMVFAILPQCATSQAPAENPRPVAASELAQAPATAPANNPKSVVDSLMAAMAANDGEKIRSLFAANASQAYGNGTAKSGEAFFRWLDSDIIQRNGRVENAQLTASGNEVVATGQYQSNGYSSQADFLFTVEDGRITSWRMRY
ncbi:nuclear transport factor 2 family protein [Synechococcus sp. CS-601]|nr:nuclear transport factor 2 family protein [Synechococcus sp. CS-601]MCT4364902.1 nuclear transport factor 2 family protein [Candidatus Regnicoccus frigidus MAG-AL1]